MDKDTFMLTVDDLRYTVKNRVDDIQKQVDAIDVRLAGRHGVSGGYSQKSLADYLKQNESLAKLIKDGKGQAFIHFQGPDVELLQRKTVITESGQGFATTGVVPIERIAGIVSEARPQLFLRDLLTSRQTSQAIVDFIRVTTPMAKASPQVEGTAKAEQALSFTASSEKIVTIASWHPVSKQAMEDLNSLAAFISGSLMFYLGLGEELEMLFGDASANHLNGLATQAQTFDTSLLPSPATGYSYLDTLACAVQQIAASSELFPDFCVLNPTDFGKIRRIKTSQGEYLCGTPMATGPATLWDMRVIQTSNMPKGYFLIGSSSPAACAIYDRQDAVVEVSNSHDDYWVRNQLAVRCERRCTLVTYRPDSFCYGSLLTSP